MSDWLTVNSDECEQVGERMLLDEERGGEKETRLHLRRI